MGEIYRDLKRPVIPPPSVPRHRGHHSSIWCPLRRIDPKDTAVCCSRLGNPRFTQILIHTRRGSGRRALPIKHPDVELLISPHSGIDLHLFVQRMRISTLFQHQRAADLYLVQQRLFGDFSQIVGQCEIK